MQHSFEDRTQTFGEFGRIHFRLIDLKSRFTVPSEGIKSIVNHETQCKLTLFWDRHFWGRKRKNWRTVNAEAALGAPNLRFGYGRKFLCRDAGEREGDADVFSPLQYQVLGVPHHSTGIE
jgi:hypothetical protein